MYSVTKIFQFDCAHMLAGHAGLCKNVHGHTYKVEVTLTAEDLIEEGTSRAMVMDFSHLKKHVKEVLFDQYDHAFVTDKFTTDECEIALVKVLNNFGKRVVDFPGRVTAENMSEHFFAHIERVLMDLELDEVNVSRVRVWETPTSYADFTE